MTTTTMLMIVDRVKEYEDMWVDVRGVFGGGWKQRVEVKERVEWSIYSSRDKDFFSVIFSQSVRVGYFICRKIIRGVYILSLSLYTD